MNEPKHTTGDSGFVASVVRHVGSGMALVLVVAGAFWGIGQARGPDQGDPVITRPAATSASPATETDQDSTSVAADSTPPTATAPPTSADTGEASPTSAGAATPTTTDEASPSASIPDIDPAEVSLQILDAAGDDGSRAEAAAATLRDDGHPIAARNQAVRGYESSTLFYTDGHEAEARAIAAAHPQFGVVEEKPANLSESVDVHVIVGADYPES